MSPERTVCQAHWNLPGGGFAGLESWGETVTPTVQDYRGVGSGRLPISLGSCPPLVESGQWPSGLSSVSVGSTKPPQGFSNARRVNMGLHPTSVLLPGFSISLTLDHQEKWPELGIKSSELCLN